MWIMLIIIASFCGVIAGMGIGGGSIFILLSTIFSLFEHKEAQGYNLIMFIAVGLSATVFNLKNKNIEKNMFKKLIIPVCIGSIIGVMLVKGIKQETLQIYFYIFIILIGIYEIIASLKNMICGKDNTKEIERS